MPDRKFDILVINADGTDPVNLTNTSQFNEGNPAWSPDGRRIAFASNRGSQNSNSNIWVMDADGSNPRLATTAVGHNTEPAWTPDSRRLVFQSTRDFNPEIYIVEVDGGANASAASGSIALPPFRPGAANQTKLRVSVLRSARLLLQSDRN